MTLWRFTVVGRTAGAQGTFYPITIEQWHDTNDENVARQLFFETDYWAKYEVNYIKKVELVQRKFDVEKCIKDATENRYTFVCTPIEFGIKYGHLTDEDFEKIDPYIVLCKDGMIRPR